MNTGVKEIQQVNPGGPDNSQTQHSASSGGEIELAAVGSPV